MNKKKILGMPIACSIGIVAFCLLGIIIGSFKDFEISTALANKTELGTFFANYGSYLSYCLYPAAGMCIFLQKRLFSLSSTSHVDRYISEKTIRSEFKRLIMQYLQSPKK